MTDAETTDGQASSAAARARRARDRKRRGAQLVTLEVTKATIDRLVGLGLVPEADRADHDTLRDAVVALARAGLQHLAQREEVRSAPVASGTVAQAAA